MKDFFDIVKRRESCRKYNGKEVKKLELLKIMEAARLAPSAVNSQPWKFFVVTDREKRKLMTKYTQAFTEKAGGFIVLLQEKPNIMSKVGSVIKNQEYTQIDLGIVTAHICLAATQLGLETCIMGWFNEKKVKELLQIPGGKRVRLVISVGHSDFTSPRPKKRKDMDEIVSFIE
ncbi:MAG: nitroreductase family protein [Bacillota bacterium]